MMVFQSRNLRNSRGPPFSGARFVSGRVYQRFVDLWDDCRSKSLRWTGFKRLLIYFPQKVVLVSAISPSYLVYRYLRLVNSRDNHWIPVYNHFTIPWIDHEFTIWPHKKKTSQWYIESIYRMSHWSFFFFGRIFLLVSLFSSLGPASTRFFYTFSMATRLRRPTRWGAGVGFFRRDVSRNENMV